MSKYVFILIRRELTRDHNTIRPDTKRWRLTRDTAFYSPGYLILTKWHTNIGFFSHFYNQIHLPFKIFFNKTQYLVSNCMTLILIALLLLSDCSRGALTISIFPLKYPLTRLIVYMYIFLILLYLFVNWLFERFYETMFTKKNLPKSHIYSATYLY